MTVDLDISPEKVAWIILRAREYEAKFQPFNADAESAAEEPGGILEDRGDDPTIRELAAFIRGLNVDEQANLVALTWVGRGSYGPDEWDEVLARAKREQPTSAIRYLLQTPTLASDLEAGLDALGFRPASLEEGIE